MSYVKSEVIMNRTFLCLILGHLAEGFTTTVFFYCISVVFLLVSFYYAERGE